MPLGYIIEPKELPKDYQPPELFSHTISSGDALYGMVFKPPGMQKGVKYPVVLSVYGGPEVQVVTNTFKGVRYNNISQWLAVIHLKYIYRTFFSRYKHVFVMYFLLVCK